MIGKRLNKISLLDDFRPLTHIEIEQGKLLRVKLSDKLMYVTRLQTVNNFLMFNQNKNYILSQLKETAENTTPENKIFMLAYYRMAVDLLLQIAELPRGFFKRYFFKRRFYDFFLNDSEALFNLFQSILDYNTRLFFLLNQVVKHQIFQQEPYTRISRGVSTADPKAWEPRYT